ncbi:hypothetical protein SLU01_15450 [Sporosarcina luteola]|uniref:Lipoprotein n=1 Tax=Sporosarcina luteola TaxID=582850 RepID=A0A511Z710_9BACL|nr:hypothetical protein [Sporosarcina luteola]GEN83233.1 hypothetical protein SLU01_15450 [Sporosarcina luteola]
MKKAAYIIIFILTLLLTGCNDGKPKGTTSKMTIEPYTLNEHEKLLVSKTGVGHIDYFKLNGTLGEDEDLELSVELFKNGEFQEELMKTWGALDKKYKDILLSFGISDFNGEDDSEKIIKLISGMPSGVASTNYTTTMTASSIGNLIGTKITLKKNEPVYLVAWVGTTKNSLRSIGSVNGELPEGIIDFETALLYKIVLTNKDKE